MDIRKTIPLAIILVTLCSILFIYIHYVQLIKWIQISNTEAAIKCNMDEKKTNASLTESSNSVLRKLAEYEKVCGGAVVNELMTFTSMPSTHDDAVALASETAATLKEFAKHNIPPLVLLEPNLTVQTDLTSIRQGSFDEVLKTYFNTLKTAGIQDEEMGTWVLFPEANTPIWPTTNPADFAANVTKVSKLQKDFFPASKVSILLNSRTYQGDDKDWSHGELKSLIPYVTGIPAGTIDSFGYQGFPSVSARNAQHTYSQLEANDFLPDHFAADTAKELGTQNIWINTGTFGRIHTGSTDTEVSISTEQRDKTLHGILEQAKKLKAQKFNVSINIFAEDKSSVDEHIDWSYWQPGKALESSTTKILSRFIHNIRTENMQFSLYDDNES